MKHKASGKRSLPVRPLSLERRSSLTVVSFWLALLIYFSSIVCLQCCRVYHVDWQAFGDVAHIVISSTAPTEISLKKFTTMWGKADLFIFYPVLTRRVGQCVCACLHLATCCLCERLHVCAWAHPTVYASVDVCLCTCVNVYACYHVRMCSVVMFVTFHVGGSAERQAICSVLKIDML